MGKTTFKKLLERWFKPRFAIFYPFAAYVILRANMTDTSLQWGIWFLLFGLGIRIWANGYAIKTAQLTTCGPYRFVRHPLYLGTFMIVVGLIILLQQWIWGGLLLVLILSTYPRTIRKEEELLENRFADEYREYKKHVAAFFPRFSGYTGTEAWPFSFRRLFRSQEYKLSFWIIIVVLFFYVKDKMIIEKEGFTTAVIIAIAAAVCLALLDLVGEFLRKHIAAPEK